MAIFRKPVWKALVRRNREIPEGLFTKCPSCGEVVHNLALAENLRVCPKCDHHFTMGCRDRVGLLLDEGTFAETDANMVSVDPLKFTGVAAYEERLKTYQERTGLKDAVLTGTGTIGGAPVALAVMDFSFLGASMGSVVGEKITRSIELATKKKMPSIVVCASGGARMYEGILSLMQMAKTSGALARHAKARLPYLAVLTNPTMAGVSASFASLGDVIVAEPKSMIGFAGPRVIKETTHQDLPDGFQTAEFLEKRGLVDHIVHRARMKELLGQLLTYLAVPARGK
jgi:acetyl-CoA carboxylase carboxyl transferase subunit beta